MDTQEYAEKRNTLVFEALGTASVCWESPEGAGVFDSTRAKEVGEKLVADLEALEAESALWSVTNRGAGDVSIVIGPSLEGVPVAAVYHAMGTALRKVADMLIESALIEASQGDFE